MRKKLLVLVAAMVLFTACTENKSEGEATSSESISSAATSIDAFEEKETTVDFTYTIINDTETVLTESQSMTVTSEITETSAEAKKNLVPVLTVKNIDSETNSLSWTEVDGAESYMLYLLNNETGEFEEYGEIKGTSCKDKNLTPNIKYTYAAAAVYAAEISIHADGLLGISPISNIRYSSVLVADMTCYESSIESDMYINMVDYTNMQSKKYGGKYDC